MISALNMRKTYILNSYLFKNGRYNLKLHDRASEFCSVFTDTRKAKKFNELYGNMRQVTNFVRVIGCMK